MPCCSSTIAVTASDVRFASSGKFGSHTQNQRRSVEARLTAETLRAGDGLTGSASTSGKACCTARVVGAASRSRAGGLQTLDFIRGASG